MRNSLIITALLLLAGFSSQLLANPKLVPAAPEIPAKAYLLIDQQSGYILASKNRDERIRSEEHTSELQSH